MLCLTTEVGDNVFITNLILCRLFSPLSRVNLRQFVGYFRAYLYIAMGEEIRDKKFIQRHPRCKIGKFRNLPNVLLYFPSQKFNYFRHFFRRSSISAWQFVNSHFKKILQNGLFIVIRYIFGVFISQNLFEKNEIALFLGPFADWLTML